MRGHIALGIIFTALAVTAQESSSPDVAIAQFGTTWYGPDGPWSAAEVAIGTPEQKVYLTVATLQDTILPITPDACNGLSDCINGRGSAYNQTGSSTWVPTSNRDAELGADMSAGVMANGQAYGIEVRGLPGLDTVSIGGVPGIKSVSVGAIKTTRMNNGLLGLRNITNQMYLQRLIPSPSWSYNPGSDDGRRPPQLVFGGYDPTKYLPGSRQNHSMEVASNGGPTMQVTLDRLFLNITGPEKKKTFATNSSLLGESINVIIDSSTPFCWLPRNVTDRIAQSVGAVWNATLGTTGYYVYNTSQPAFENRVNATLAFHVDGAGDTWLFNSITVSQSLFLVPPTANVPADSKLNYLPLMPVDNADTYVLGRSFLQQMYLMANYHTMQFSLSQINLNSQSKAQYIKIDAPAPPVPSAPSSQPPPERPKSKSLSGSAIAGIAIGLVIVVGLLLGVILWYTRKRLWGRKPVPTPPEADDVLKKDGVYYKELSAENLGEQGRMIPSVEPHTPTQPSLSQPPVEVPAADSPVAQELPAPPN